MNADYLPDIQSQLQAFINALKGNNIDQNTLYNQIIAVFFALYGEIMRLRAALTSLGDFTKLDREHKFTFENNNKGNEMQKEIISKEKKLEELKNKGKFIEENKWKKMSTFEKLKERFNMNEFKQNPFFSVWNGFKLEEKKEWIKLRAAWRIKKAEELLKLEENPKKLQRVNNFFFYEWRDKNGFALPTYELDDLKEYNNMMNNDKSIQELRNYLNNGSMNHKIKGFIICDGNLIPNKGQAFWHNSLYINRGLYNKNKNTFVNKKRNRVSTFPKSNINENANF